MFVAYARGLGSRWMALPADLRGVVAGRIWARCGPRMGRDDFRPCAYPQVRAMHLISGVRPGIRKSAPSRIRTCAHGSGVHIPARLLPAETSYSLWPGARMGGPES